MKVNFLVESQGPLRFLGCATVADQLRTGLKGHGIKVSMNSKEKGFDIVHAHTFGPFVLSKLGTGRVKVISAHSTPSLNTENVRGNVAVWNSLYRNIYNRFDRVIAVSNDSVKELRRIGVKPKIKVIPLGIDLQKFKFSESKRRSFRKLHGIGDELVVLNVAQTTPRKGVFDFIELAERMPHVRFFWVGGMPYSVMTSNFFSVKGKIRKAPENLKFLGFVDDVVAAYCGADVFLTPSKSESFGLTLVEAGACGLPVMARDLGVFRELFGNGIAYASTVDGMEKRIESFMDEGERKKCSKRCFAMSRKYGIEDSAKKLAAFYRSIV